MEHELWRDSMHWQQTTWETKPQIFAFDSNSIFYILCFVVAVTVTIVVVVVMAANRFWRWMKTWEDVSVYNHLSFTNFDILKSSNWPLRPLIHLRYPQRLTIFIGLRSFAYVILWLNGEHWTDWKHFYFCEHKIFVFFSLFCGFRVSVRLPLNVSLSFVYGATLRGR